LVQQIQRYGRLMGDLFSSLSLYVSIVVIVKKNVSAPTELYR
jgi:hypothetical protein